MLNEMLDCVNPGASANPEIVNCRQREPLLVPHALASNGIIFKCTAEGKIDCLVCPRGYIADPFIPPLPSDPPVDMHGSP